MSVSNLNSSGQGKMNAPYQIGTTDMMRMLLQRLTAAGGCLLIDDSQAHSDNFYAFIAQEDTVISAITGINNAGSVINFGDLLGLTGATLHQGALVSVGTDETITSITLTSGSVIAYRARH